MQLARRQGCAEEITLCVVASLGAKEVELLLRFHALRNDEDSFNTAS